MTLSERIDTLNIGLIAMSLVIAFIIPFRLFLFVYAVLGPLHYLTEINWLRDKNYFVKQRKWVWLPVLLAVFVLLPKVFLLPDSGIDMSENLFGPVIHWIDKYNNGFIFVCLALAAGLVLTKNRTQLWVVCLFGAGLAVLLNSVNIYVVIVGLLIPTVLHVYVFTLLFMLYGALKSKSRPGYISVLLLATSPIIIALVMINPELYDITENIKQTFIAGNFYKTNSLFGKSLGLSDGTQFSFEALLDIRIQIFMAFAYTYHYLNWFSKTTVIGWHKNLNTRKSLIILVLWILSMTMYWYDYSIGLIALLTLSILHVFLEFPLNLISIKGIVNHFTIFDSR